jgi:hypothetical protein
MKPTTAMMNKPEITNPALASGVETDGGRRDNEPLNLRSVAGLAKSPA